MVDRLLSFVLLLVLGLWAGLPGSATAQDRPLPSQQHSQALQSASSLPTASLPAVRISNLRTRTADTNDRITPYQYGKIVETNYRPEQHGVWEQLPSGDWLWRLRIQSQEAVSLSLTFTRFALPKGASLYAYDPDHDLIRGPYTAADATDGAHRTPLVRGDAITIELVVPSDGRETVDLKIGKVVHGYRSLSVERDASASKAGACNLDIACDQSAPWRNQVRSIARYTYENGGDTFVCSGSLVNNTKEDETPYFLTAEHCIPDASTASTMVFYWNFQNSTCRNRGTNVNGTVTKDDPADQTSSGAILRARYGNVHDKNQISGKPDLALVEVDDVIPDSYELYFSGWNREGTTTSESVTIHHPQGDGKRISFDQDPTSQTGYLKNTGGTTHLRIGDWETGTTEGGSSGSPLYDPDQRIVGVLSGGFAGCDGGIDDNNDPDWYGRIAPGFENGDYTPPGKSSPTTLADFLDPNNSGVQTLEGRNLASSPPGSVSNFEITNITPDSVTFQWISSGDDGNTGKALIYDLRFRNGAPIDSESDFLAAQQVKSDLPSPEPSGTLQSATVSISQDTSFYFALRSYDEAYQSSPLVTTDQTVTLASDLNVTRSPYPNPAGKNTKRVKIDFAVEEPQTVRASLYDVLGRRVRTVFSREVSSRFQTQTEEVDLSGLSSGIYFLRLRGESTSETKKIIVKR